MSFTIKSILKNIVAIISLVFVSNCFAGNMDDMMAGMFNGTLSNYTPGGVYQAQGRGVIAGPSIYARNKVSNIQLISVTPPHYSVSCNGIDAYTGSFSFISADKLINALRNIASNMAPFAFSMAIEALCPNCEKQMAKLQKWAQDINANSINTCQAAKNIMAGTAGKFLQTQFNDMAADIMALDGTGSAADFFGVKTDPANPPDTTLKANDPAKAEKMESNIAWVVLQKSDAAQWYNAALAGANNAAANEVIMSFTGTRIKRYEDADDGLPHWEDKRFDSTLTLQDFLMGGNVTVMTCDSTVKCLFPNNTTTRNIMGFRRFSWLMLFGSANDGIISKISSSNLLSLQEQRFIEFAPGSILTHLKRLSTSPETAKAYGEFISDYIAAELAAHFVTDLIQGTRIQAVKENNEMGSRDYLDALEKLAAQLNQEILVSQTRLASVERNINVANLLRQNINSKSKVLNTVPVISKF